MDDIETIFSKSPNFWYTEIMPPVFSPENAIIGDYLLYDWSRSDNYLTCNQITGIFEDYFICGNGAHKYRIEKSKALYATKTRVMKLIRKSKGQK